MSLATRRAHQKRHVCVWIVAAVLAGCAADPGPGDPGDVVLRYRDALARDPVRTLALLAPAFHRAHGLRFHEVGDLPPASGERRAERPASAPPPSDDPELELERARLGWLTVLTRPAFARLAPDLALAVEDVDVSDDAARVAARVRMRERPAFRARFRLTRADGVWRIEAIEIEGERALHVVPVYLLAPTRARHLRLEAWRGARTSSRRIPAHSSVHASDQSGGSHG